MSLRDATPPAAPTPGRDPIIDLSFSVHPALERIINQDVPSAGQIDDRLNRCYETLAGFQKLSEFKTPAEHAAARWKWSVAEDDLFAAVRAHAADVALQAVACVESHYHALLAGQPMPKPISAEET